MLRIPQKDGSFLTISRKKSRKTNRKRGRPRKKYELPPEKPSRKRPYSIIITSRGKQKEFIKNFRDEQSAYTYFTEMLEKNKNIRFPIKNLNYKGIEEAKYELFIIKKIDTDKPQNDTYLRNEYGELVKHETNSKEWMVIDKANWNIEETFWVHGYDPLYQRKNFDWIFNNLILAPITKDYAFANILVYQNKLIIDIDDTLNIVFCKCVSDSYRLYTELETECKERKIKNIMFSGNIREFSKQTITSWIDRMCETTGFSRMKILRNSLRP